MKNLPQINTATIPLGSEQAYLNAINLIPMLSQEEERDLAKRYHNNSDLQAARRLVMSHLRFVAKIAQGYSGYGLNFMDLVQEGSVGLMKAVKRFDPSVGVRLVSFAVHWIKAEIHEFIIRNWRIVKIATTKAQRKLFFNLRSMKKHLGFTSEEVEHVAKTLNVSTQEVWRMDTRLHAKDMSLDLPTDDSEDDHNYMSMAYLEDHSQDPARMLEYADTEAQSHAQLGTALANLDERSQHILQVRWLAEKKATLHELADKYQVSPERIRQIEKQAMNKLKRELVNFAH
ncbi:MAG: RNA polymerase sigma factor RpoH [Legionellales bacterium]|nr:RNA polymerase sigma factor RpoH [Legionellales bacterium]|tara:strand:+ start:1561 stop:2421 length:861 start_codon:yes stop_codon:yes gene_type:complete